MCLTAWMPYQALPIGGMKQGLEKDFVGMRLTSYSAEASILQNELTNASPYEERYGIWAESCLAHFGLPLKPLLMSY